MHRGKYVFAQVMEVIPHRQFQECTNKYKGHYRIKNFTCWDQFLAMSFGQLAYRESIRDIVACLKAHDAKRYHLGFRSSVVRSTLTDANEKRDWRIYRDLAQMLIEQARKLYIDDHEFTLDLDGACYALDSTSIDLCLSLFKWAPYVETKGAVKVHTQMDLRGSIPTHFEITSGKVNDVNFLDMIEYESGAHYVMDRGYVDFERLYRIHHTGAFFVTRAKRNVKWRRLYSSPVDRSGGLCCDQIIVLTGVGMYKKYPDKIRRVKYYDSESDHYYVFLTNDFNIDAKTVADLYKYRWQIELFFKWIKQHLKVKTFWGHSENAVKTQICIAICTYLIVAIVKKRLGIEQNLYEILQILSASLFDKTPVKQLFSDGRLQSFDIHPQNTLPLLDF
jgi:hypothetical protein